MIQFSLYSEGSYQDATHAQQSGALYDLISIDSFDEPSGATQVADAQGFANVAAECLGYDGVKLAYTTTSDPKAKDVEDVFALFGQKVLS